MHQIPKISLMLIHTQSHTQDASLKQGKDGIGFMALSLEEKSGLG
jgi:hypothetical protein